jgi:AcrR family transcriptional regulator
MSVDSATATTATRSRGRPAAATRQQVLAAARQAFVTGHRVDVRAIASELGLSRMSVYRWFGSREQLLGEILLGEFAAIFDRARARAGRGPRGGELVLATIDAVNRALAGNDAFRGFWEQESAVALRVITSSVGPVHPPVVDAVTALIEQEIDEHDYQPPVQPAPLAYALVRLSEAFLYSDATAGIRGDVDRLREVQAALLGIGSAQREEIG